MKNMFVISGMILTMLLTHQAWSAEAGAGSAGAYLKMGTNARALGLGNAYVAACDDASAMYWNPAALARVTREELQAGYTAFPEQADFTQLAFALPLDLFSYTPLEADHRQTRLGTLGMSFIRYTAGVAIEARQTDSLNPDYLFSDSEGSYGLGYGFALGNTISLGIVIKGLFHQLDRTQAIGWGSDLGVLWQIHPRLTIGLAIRDAWTQLTWDTGYQESFPSTIKAGAAYQVPMGEQQVWLMTMDVEQSLTSRPLRLRAGGEYALAQCLFGRVGYDDGVLSLGGGVGLRQVGWSFGDLHLDYAALQDRIAGWDHWLTLRLRF